MPAIESEALPVVKTAPRWPSSRVVVDERAYRALQYAQQRLAANIGLILTRGHEPRGPGIGWARNLFRGTGILAFALLFPNRRQEIGPIFGANGHDVDGTHVDISIEIEGKRLRLLPLGVFTPLWLQKAVTAKHAPTIAAVCDALRASGFRIHPNGTEALQIHCDYLPTA